MSEWDDIFGGKPVKDTPKDEPSEMPKVVEKEEEKVTTPETPKEQTTLEETVTIPKVEAGETVEVEVRQNLKAVKLIPFMDIRDMVKHFLHIVFPVTFLFSLLTERVYL